MRYLKPLKLRQICVYVYAQIWYKLSGWEGVHSFFQLLTLPKVETSWR